MTGWMQFVDTETPSQYWTMTEGTPVVVDVPYPPNAVTPVNLPLRITLGWLTVSTLTGDVAPDQWQVATSLVARRDLEVVFPTTYAAFETKYGHWQLAGLHQPIRDALCTIQGLRRP